MEDMLDNLEKTLTFISPVKDGLGVSTLDRTLRDDRRRDQFYAELAALKAQKVAAAARVASGSCDVRPIGEVRRIVCGMIACPADDAHFVEPIRNVPGVSHCTVRRCYNYSNGLLLSHPLVLLVPCSLLDFVLLC